MPDDRYGELLKILKEKSIPLHVQHQIALMYNATDKKPSFLRNTISSLSKGIIPHAIDFPHEITLQSDWQWDGATPDEDVMTSQKLTITDEGQVYLSHYNCDQHLLREEQFSISPMQAITVLNKICNFFTVYEEKPRCTDTGSWNLTISDQANRKHTFSGDLLCEKNGWLTSISELIRNILCRNDLLLFDNGGNTGTALYSCEFEFDGKRYFYKAEGLQLCMGDRVVVPCGNDGKTDIATIVDIEFLDENSFSFSIKDIIEKVEPHIPVSNPTTFDIVKSVIDVIDCEGLLAMLCPADEYDGESRKIAERIVPSMSAYQIATIIAETMSTNFNEPYEANSFIIAGAQILAHLA